MANHKQANEEKSPTYRDNYAHLADELPYLDLLIQRRVTIIRQKSQLMQDISTEPQTFISHTQVDWLLAQHKSLKTEPPELTELGRQLEARRQEIQAKVMASIEQGIFLALPQLAHLFALSPFELQTVVICLAPELQRKYDKLYTFLQDDITRQKPSVDLVLDLLCETESERWQARTLFSEHAPLFRAGILQTSDDPQSPSGSSGLAQFLKLDQRILNYLLGNNSLDGRLGGLVNMIDPSTLPANIVIDSDIKKSLLNFTTRHFAEPTTEQQRLVLYLHGPYGAGKWGLAVEICRNLGCPLLRLDMELLLLNGTDLDTILRLVFREGLLWQGALYFDTADILVGEDSKATALIKKLAALNREFGWLTFLAAEKPWAPQGLFSQAVFQAIHLPIPEVPLRQSAWETALERFGPSVDRRWAGLLARQFRLTPGQIQDAAAFMENERALHGPELTVTLDGLYTACRRQSNQKLTESAFKIVPHYGWADIILPQEKLAVLHEICNQVTHRYRVFNEWGFDQKLAHGKGLSALFSGPPGTGKTMAAEVIAHELQLDLYKIDLAGVVSKYIGETEKNLAKIFQEAETSNAILFFDEADALFGKRTEISDAHDRYANVETSYLLQKMEEYEGVVILATNLRENMDEAFTRRIRFIVEFPFPDVASRQEIWQTHFPNEAPVSDSLDYQFLARQFQIAGGNIKNIVLNAAFFAAENGGNIEMKHILRSTRREYEKIGKLWDEKTYSLSEGT